LAESGFRTTNESERILENLGKKRTNPNPGEFGRNRGETGQKTGEFGRIWAKNGQKWAKMGKKRANETETWQNRAKPKVSPKLYSVSVIPVTDMPLNP
jgi:hypothetical protein